MHAQTTVQSRLVGDVGNVRFDCLDILLPQLADDRRHRDQV
jgi:hypothetical protein